MSPRYLITGATGFIGAHLAASLTQKGIDVVAIDKRAPLERLPGVEYHVCDVRDLDRQSFKGPIGRIYNLAAIHTTPGHEPFEYYDTNVTGALQITRLAERLGVPEIVFTSSISVYGPSEETKTEESTPAPISDYGRSKFLAEEIHRRWRENDTSRRLIIVRPAVVFGPKEGGNFTRLAGLLKKGFFIYPGRKDTIKACIYVHDLISAVEFASDQSDAYILFNGAYPGRHTLEEIVNILISRYFPGTKSILLPRPVVSLAATVIGALGFLNLGVHPERVTKLVRSTDVSPEWLKGRGFQFPSGLEEIMARWHDDTKGTFI